MDFHLHIEILPAFSPHVDQTALRDAVAAALQEKPPSGTVELSLVITNDHEIRRLNRTYRAIDAPTDVLSFGMGESPFPSPGEDLYLGDIILSYPRAAEQAREYGHSTQAELNLLAIHGVLHLLGYDHETAQDQREMWRLQEHALAQLASRERNTE